MAKKRKSNIFASFSSGGLGDGFNYRHRAECRFLCKTADEARQHLTECDYPTRPPHSRSPNKVSRVQLAKDSNDRITDILQSQRPLKTEVEGEPLPFRTVLLDGLLPTKGDLLVLKVEIDNMLEEAKVLVVNLEENRDSLAIVMELEGESGRLTKAQAKIAELENSLRLANAAVKEAKSRHLTAQLVHAVGRTTPRGGK